MDLPVDVGELVRTLRTHGVVFALAFGSQVDGTGRPASDLDLAVWGTEPIDGWQLRGALPDGVDLVDLRGAPEGLAGRIAMTGVVVMDDDPPQRIRWQAQTRKRHLDEEARRARFRRDFIAAHG